MSQDHESFFPKFPQSSLQFRQLEPNDAFSILRHLETGLVDLQWACGVSSELIVFRETRRLPGLHELHGRAFVPMSYHIVTALGGVRLILASGSRPSLFFLVASCIISTLDAAEHIAPNIAKMRQNVPPDFRRSVEVADTWARACVEEVQRALQIIRDYAGDRWPILVQEVRRYQEEIRRIREGLEGY